MYYHCHTSDELHCYGALQFWPDQPRYQTYKGIDSTRIVIRMVTWIIELTNTGILEQLALVIATFT